MKKLSYALISIVVGLTVLSGCSEPKTPEVETPPTKQETPEEPEEEKPEEEAKIGGEITLATTTSTENSGLLDFILPVFKEDTGIEVKVVSVGTGQAIKMGEDGEVDVLLVHDTASEEKFVADGHTDARYDVMYNDFVVIGPEDDKDGIKANFGSDIIGFFKEVADKELTFVSRGDDSGTHKMELRLFEEAGVEEPSGDWYKSIGKGMGDTINMANESEGYTLTDRATYLAMMKDIALDVLVENDDKLFNPYGVMAVDPEKNELINNEGALAFIEWILSDKGQELIGEFGVEEFGQALFIPDAK